jgi:hypothetical protein
MGSYVRVFQYCAVEHFINRTLLLFKQVENCGTVTCVLTGFKCKFFRFYSIIFYVCPQSLLRWVIENLGQLSRLYPMEERDSILALFNPVQQLLENAVSFLVCPIESDGAFY